MKKLAALVLVCFSFLLLPSMSKAQADPIGAIATEIGCAGGEAAKIFPNADMCKAFAGYLSNIFTKKPNSPWYAPTPTEFSNKVLNGNPSEIFGERYTFAQINWIINSFITLLNPIAGKQSPMDIINFFIFIKTTFLSNNIQNPPTMSDYAKLGPLGLFGMAMQWPYQHPIASGVTESKLMVSRVLDIGTGVTPVSAQGIGYSKLSEGNIKTLWTATRNISYLVTIVILVAAGFMVMFRTQINPQTVVSVQMVIPKLAVSLVLITFSYAIVGFVIDMIYVVIVAFIGLLSAASPGLFSAGAGGMPFTITQLTSGNYNFILSFLATPITISVILIIIAIIIPIVLAFGGGATAPSWLVLVPIASAVIGIFAWALYSAARIVGQLLMAYLSLILLTISAPLQIMMDVIPNQKNNNFMNWLKCVIGNASVFVTYIILAIIARTLFRFGQIESIFGTGDLGFNLNNTVLRETFLLPGANFNLNFSTGNIMSLMWWLLIGMGYFTAVPNIVQGVKDMLCKEQDQSKFIEGFVKDTVGQITNAGQKAGESLGKARAEGAAKAASAAAAAGGGKP